MTSHPNGRHARPEPEPEPEHEVTVTHVCVEIPDSIDIAEPFDGFMFIVIDSNAETVLTRRIERGADVDDIVNVEARWIMQVRPDPEPLLFMAYHGRTGKLMGAHPTMSA